MLASIVQATNWQQPVLMESPASTMYSQGHASPCSRVTRTRSQRFHSIPRETRSLLPAAIRLAAYGQLIPETRFRS